MSKEFGKFIPDIVLPSMRMIVEVKYGESCFGKEDGSSHEQARYRHVCRQYSRYKKSGYKIVYVVVARMNELIGIPPFIEQCEQYDLTTMECLRITNRRAIKTATKQTLQALYETPVIVRGINFADNPEYMDCRKKLFTYLKNNNSVYPSQGKMHELFGVSNRYMDRALGLGRRVNNRHRIQVLKDMYAINTHAQRNFYTESRTPKEPVPSVSVVNNMLKDLYPNQKLRVEEQPRRYKRGAANNIWINVICSVHGHCLKPKRWLDIKKGCAGCSKCSNLIRAYSQRMPIPSIAQVNKVLIEVYPDQELRAAEQPKRYFRVSRNTVWVKVVCKQHGLCPTPKPWSDLQAGRTGCRECYKTSRND